MSRPKTLVVSIMPVLAAWSLAEFTKTSLFFLISFLALNLQIISNVANDLFDGVQGADTEKRKGPLRLTKQGIISRLTTLKIICVLLLISILGGCYLVYKSGLVVLFVGIASILCAILYSGGPYPLAYHGFGELLAFIFFGPVALVTTYYIFTESFSLVTILQSFVFGLVSAGLLLVNNIRDYQEDLSTGKNTLAVKIGQKYSILLLKSLLVLPILLEMLSVYLYGFGMLAVIFNALLLWCFRNKLNTNLPGQRELSLLSMMSLVIGLSLTIEQIFFINFF
jgi:1,4-dihydroxy-2-naphthoate polyprenyltransferase